MSIATAEMHGGGHVSRRGSFGWAVNDTIVLAARSLSHIVREPETLMDVTVQPVVFVLLFAYVFGSAIPIPGGNYHEYLIGGMFGMGAFGTVPGTAVALVTDASTGLFDRFRSLPVARAAVLAGRILSDLVTQMIGAAVLVATGLAIGWRIHTGPGPALTAVGLTLLLGYTLSWAGACLGMVLRSPEAAQQVGFIAFLPLTFVSNVFVPTAGMPGWLQAVANWNPLSALAASCRGLFGNPNPAGGLRVWPMQHPELAVLLWAASILVVFAPLAVRLYRRRSRGWTRAS